MARRFVRFAGVLGTVALAVTTIIALPGVASAQQGVTTGSVVGRVTDTGGSPLADATVILQNAETGTTREVQTSADGRFTAGFLQPGRYTVTAQFPPLEPEQQGPIQVSLGDQKVVDFVMQPVEAEAIAVTLRGENQVDVSQGGVVELVNEQQIENLPALGRDFTDFINLSGLVSPAPEVGTGGQFALGGGRTSATNLQIDGADANNSFFGENRGGSRIPFTFSLESIKEFQIITNGFDVEFGNYTGGVVNAVTKGGTNEFTGSAFFYQRDEALTAETFDEQDPEAFSASQFGFRLGGPIVLDQAHFFVSLDGQQRDQPVFAMVPDVWCPACDPGVAAARIEELKDILNEVYGLSEAELESNIGTFEETEDELAIFGRLDWQVNERNQLVLRHNYSDFENENDRVSPEEALTHGGPFKDTSNSFVSELTSVMGDRGQGYNTFRFQWSDEDRPRPANSLLPEFDIDTGDPASDLEYFGDGIVFANRLEERKFQLVDNLTWQLGEEARHTVKVGTNNIFSKIQNLFWLFGNGTYDFDSLEDLANRAPSRYQRNLRADGEPPFAEFNINEYAVYAQDEWQATDKLLVALGLRYDTNVFVDPAVENQSIVEAFGRSTTTVPEDRNNIGPRIAFTYDIEGDETSVIRGGAGLLYGRAPYVLHGNVMQTVPPLLSLDCRGDDVPEPDVQFFLQNPGNNNPTTCAGGAGELGGVPQFSLWDEDFQSPQSWKLNFGYERILESGWRAAVDVLYGRTTHNFDVQNINLDEVQFVTAPDNRPVFSSPFSIDNFFTGQSRANPDFAEVFFNTDEAESEAWILNLKASRRFEGFSFNGSYTYNNIYDNSSFFCCTAGEGFGTKEVGAHNPNVIGDPGDDVEGTWGHAEFERRHVFVFSSTWEGPWGVDVSGIWRSQSGTPYTLIVEGDVNGDGEAFNDRAPVFAEGLLFEDAGEEAQWDALLAGGGDEAGECLREAVGGVARRNTCNNPWWHAVDLHLAKEFPFAGGQSVEIIADLFNVLNALNDDWGEFNITENTVLSKEGLDEESSRIIYSVNDDFGTKSSLPFTQLQAQAQLGVRYRF